MSDPNALLAWLQIHDSAFPSGRFVHSNGVESWLSINPHASVDEICSLAMAFVMYSAGTLDAVATAYAWAASDCDVLIELDDLLTSHKLSENARTASQTCGRQLAILLLKLNFPTWSPAADYLSAVSNGQAAGNLAVVEGTSQHALGIDQHDAVLGSVWSAHSGILSAAVRLGRLGSVRAQKELLLHRDELVRLAFEAVGTPIDEMYSAVIELEICAMQHETRSARTFTT
jgi:urease accessory protein